MRTSSVEAIAAALNEAGVRFLIVGGLAVNAHGYGRATFDLDIVIELTRASIAAFFEAVGALGYRPQVPIRPADFEDPETRERLATEKGMVVLHLASDRHRETPIDVFSRAPFEFEKEYERAYIEELSPNLVLRFVALDTLLTMKAATGRPRDLDDVEHLRWLNEEPRHEQ